MTLGAAIQALGDPASRSQSPDLSRLSHEEKDALILALWAQVQALTARVAALGAQLGSPPKTPDNSSLPPSRAQKPNRVGKAGRAARARAAWAGWAADGSWRGNPTKW